jgi:hypothetical protein
MSIQDEQDLRIQLDAALGRLTPSPLPMHAVVRQGRAVMMRRRLTAVAIAAAVVIAAVVAPVLARAIGRSAPSSGQPHYHVTVYPPGPGSRPGMIAYGRINGHPWLAAGKFKHPYTVCFWTWHYGSGGCTTGSGPRLAARRGAPVSIEQGDGPGPVLYVASVRSDVTYVRIRLSDGEVLTLRPVAIFGPKYAAYVALPLPNTAALRSVTAYSAKGELAYTIPFTARGNLDLVRWLRPDQPALPRPRIRILDLGSVDGRPMTGQAYLGPWGTCFGGPGWAESCLATDVAGLAQGRTYSSFRDSRVGFVVVAVGAKVRYLLVHQSGGRAFRVTPVRIGDGRLCAFVVSGASYGWAAYSAGGIELVSGNG